MHLRVLARTVLASGSMGVLGGKLAEAQVEPFPASFHIQRIAQAHDVAGVLDALKIDKAELVTHDIGNMVGYAFAAATNVLEGIVPNSGHWVMEENPGATITMVTDFLAK